MKEHAIGGVILLAGMGMLTFLAIKGIVAGAVVAGAFTAVSLWLKDSPLPGKQESKGDDNAS